MQVKDKYFGGKDVEGEVGIEIEIEGENLPDIVNFNHAVGDIWSHHQDGSLRGNTCEVVLHKPVPRVQVKEVLQRVQQVFAEFGSKIIPSVRTGVHIHINIRHLTQEQTYIFMLLWLLFENVLVRYCGEDREGNLFCLRSMDAQSYLDHLEHSITENDFDILYTDELRYSAMNPKALCEYGSLEFRCMKTPKILINIEEWVNLLLRVKDASLEIKDPRDLLESISLQGGDKIAKEVFGDLVEKLDVEDWTLELYEGLRRIQTVVFCKEWDSPEYEDLVVKVGLPQNMEEAKEAGLLTPLQIVEYEGRLLVDDDDFEPVRQKLIGGGL